MLENLPRGGAYVSLATDANGAPSLLAHAGARGGCGDRRQSFDARELRVERARARAHASTSPRRARRGDSPQRDTPFFQKSLRCV